MKRTFVAAAAAVVMLTACNQPTDSTQNSASQANLAAAQSIARSFETGDVSAIDNAVGDNFVDHTDHGDKVGKDSLKAMITLMRENFKDMKMETLREVADSEYVFQWMRYSGTSNGSMGMPKGPYDMHSMEVSKFKDGKAVEHWAYMDMAEMMKMMGGGAGQPAMAEGMHKDSTKKM